LPLFDLSGPGENINDDMSGGEVNSEVYNADFLPNSTYSWRIDNVNPAVVHTFVTSADVEGTAVTATSPHPSASPLASAPTSQDIVGSEVAPFRGTLTAAVSGAGTLTVAYKGGPVMNLAAGRYTVVVTDRSTTNGLILEKSRHSETLVTGIAFIGKRSAPVNLTAGKWFFIGQTGKPARSIVVT
jgi:hypothetical protein